MEDAPLLFEFGAGEHAVATRFRRRPAHPERGIRLDPIPLECEAEELRDPREQPICHDRSRLRLLLDEIADLPTRDVLHPPMPPHRQYVVLVDAAQLGPTLAPLVVLREQRKERADRVAVGRALVVLLRRRIGAAENAPTRSDRLAACVRQAEIRKTPQREASLASMMAVHQSPRS